LKINLNNSFKEIIKIHKLIINQKYFFDLFFFKILIFLIKIMKKIIIFFFIGILFFLQSVKIFALTEDEIKVEQNRVVAEMEEENKTEK